MKLAARAPVIEPSLLVRIAEALAVARVRYCQWKGHFKHARWMAGDGDVDLLVEPKSFGRFTAALSELGLKRTTTDSFWATRRPQQRCFTFTRRRVW